MQYNDLSDPDDVFVSWIDGAMTAMGEIRKEAHTPTKTLAGPKTKVKVAKGCWNVRTMFSVGKTAQITTEMNCYGMYLNPERRNARMLKPGTPEY